jgi:tripartite-type tricarboxylate transporter receptor subunit TctC
VSEPAAPNQAGSTVAEHTPTPEAASGGPHAAVAAAVAEAEIRAQFERQGLEGIALPPEAFARFVAEQSAIAQAIGRRIGGK